MNEITKIRFFFVPPVVHFSTLGSEYQSAKNLNKIGAINTDRHR